MRVTCRAQREAGSDGVAAVEEAVVVIASTTAMMTTGENEGWERRGSGAALEYTLRQPLHAVEATCKLTLTDELGALTDSERGGGCNEGRRARESMRGRLGWSVDGKGRGA